MEALLFPIQDQTATHRESAGHVEIYLLSKQLGESTLLHSNTTVTWRMSELGKKSSLINIMEKPNEDWGVSSLSLLHNITSLLKDDSKPSKKSPRHNFKRYVCGTHPHEIFFFSITENRKSLYYITITSLDVSQIKPQMN